MAIRGRIFSFPPTQPPEEPVVSSTVIVASCTEKGSRLHIVFEHVTFAVTTVNGEGQIESIKFYMLGDNDCTLTDEAEELATVWNAWCDARNVAASGGGR